MSSSIPNIDSKNPSASSSTPTSSSPAQSTVLYAGLLYTPIVSSSSMKRTTTTGISYKEYYCELYAQVSNNNTKSMSLSTLGTMFAYYTGTLASPSAPQVQHFLNLFEKPPPQYKEGLQPTNGEASSTLLASNLIDDSSSQIPSNSTLSSTNIGSRVSKSTNSIINTTPIGINNDQTSLSSNNLKTTTKNSSVQFSSSPSFIKSTLPILSETMKPTLQIPLHNIALRIDPMEGYFYLCFELLSPNTAYKFFCRTDNEMKRWSEIIEKVSPISKENALIEEAERKIVELERSGNTKKQLSHNNEIRHYRMKYYHHILPTSSNTTPALSNINNSSGLNLLGTSTTMGRRLSNKPELISDGHFDSTPPTTKQ